MRVTTRRTNHGDHSEVRSTIMNLKHAGVTLDIIMRSTGLSREEIENS